MTLSELDRALHVLLGHDLKPDRDAALRRLADGQLEDVEPGRAVLHDLAGEAEEIRWDPADPWLDQGDDEEAIEAAVRVIRTWPSDLVDQAVDRFEVAIPRYSRSMGPSADLCRAIRARYPGIVMALVVWDDRAEATWMPDIGRTCAGVGQDQLEAIARASWELLSGELA